MCNTDLVWALKNGDLDEVAQHLNTKEAVNTPLGSGRNPLHYAADCGQAEILTYLLAQGADINAKDVHGITPLFSAIYEGHTECVKILLDKGADKGQKGPDGLSAYDSADCEAMKALLK